jgi:hypothetical protein
MAAAIRTIGRIRSIADILGGTPANIILRWTKYP